MDNHQEIISLKEYVDTLAQQLKQDIETRFSYSQTAVDKAERSMERRLEAMNEFRAQLNRQAETFVTKEYLDARTEAHRRQSEVEAKVLADNLCLVEDRITELQKQRANLEGRFWAIGVGIALIFTVINVLIGVIK